MSERHISFHICYADLILISLFSIHRSDNIENSCTQTEKTFEGLALLVLLQRWWTAIQHFIRRLSTCFSLSTKCFWSSRNVQFLYIPISTEIYFRSKHAWSEALNTWHIICNSVFMSVLQCHRAQTYGLARKAHQNKLFHSNAHKGKYKAANTGVSPVEGQAKASSACTGLGEL